jgi:hypothetical protein
VHAHGPGDVALEAGHADAHVSGLPQNCRSGARIPEWPVPTAIDPLFRGKEVFHGPLLRLDGSPFRIDCACALVRAATKVIDYIREEHVEAKSIIQLDKDVIDRRN